MDAQTIVNFATPVIVPLIIAGMKKIKPNIPTMIIPIICPVLGALIAFLASVLLHNQGSLWFGALLGLAAVGVREVKDQLTKPSEPKD